MESAVSTTLKDRSDRHTIDRNWWARLLSPEIPRGLLPDVERRYRLTAKFTLFNFLANIAFSIGDFFVIGDPMLIGFDLVAIPVFGLLHFYYTRTGEQRITAIWFLVLLNVWLFVNSSYYGKDGMFFLFLYTLILVTFILIDVREITLLFPFMVLPVISLITLETTDYRWFNNPDLTPSMLDQTRLMTMLVNFSLLFLFMEGIVRNTLDNERELLAKQGRLQKMTRRLQDLNALKQEYNHALELRLKQVLSEMREKERALDHAAIQGEERERQRIAQDLHDGVGALLSTLKLRLGNFQELLNEGQLEDYQRTMDLIDSACEEVRQASHNLQPLLFAELGLTNILRDLIEKINASGRLKLSLIDIAYTQRLDLEGERTLYRVVLELINNAIRHSGAGSLTIQFMSRDQQVVLTVEDDGIGYEPALIKHGLGLKGIQHRVHSLNGSLHVDTSPGCGVVTIVEVPLNNVS